MKFQYLMEKFEYCLTKSVNPKKKLNFKPWSAYFSDGAAQSQTEMVIVTSDYPLSSHQTNSLLQGDVGENAQTSVQLSHPPNITSLNIRTDLVENPMGCHIHVLPHPLSLCSVDPLDYTILCCSILNSTPVVNEDQPVDSIDVAQPTCVVIQEVYHWEPKHQPKMKDDSLLSTPPLFFPEIFGDFSIPNFMYVSLSMDSPIVDHSQNTLDVIPSSDNKEDKSFFENPLDFYSNFSGNTKGEFFCFSSTPLLILQIMRMPMKSLILLIVVVVIYLPLYLITTVILL